MPVMFCSCDSCLDHLHSHLLFVVTSVIFGLIMTVYYFKQLDERFDVNYREDVLPLDMSSLIGSLQSTSGSTRLGLFTFWKQVWSRTWLCVEVFTGFFVRIRVNNPNLHKLHTPWLGLLCFAYHTFQQKYHLDLDARVTLNVHLCIIGFNALLYLGTWFMDMLYVLPYRFEYFRQKVKVHKYCDSLLHGPHLFLFECVCAGGLHTLPFRSITERCGNEDQIKVYSD